MILNIPKNEHHWLKSFFSNQNHLLWEQIVDGTASPNWLLQVIPWLEMFRKSKGAEPIILPVFGDSGPEVWYGMAATDRMMGQLIEDITGFVGPTYSDFRGERCDLSVTNQLEHALIKRFGRHVIRFHAHSFDDQPEIVRSLLLYQHTLKRKPKTPDRVRRPFGTIRGDFDRALLVGNAEGAKRNFTELLETGRVNAEQRKCLEIRLLAGLGRHEELARNRMLIESVMDLSLPPQTIIDVVGALYETYVRDIEKSPDHQKVKDEFIVHIARHFGPLFKQRKGIILPSILRAFLLFELSQDNPSFSRCEEITLAHSKNDDGFELAHSWLESATTHTQKDGHLCALDIARQAIADEDYAVALEQSYAAFPALWAYSAILRCAIELKSKAVTNRVLETVENTNEKIQAHLTNKDHTRIKELKAFRDSLSLSNYDDSWVAWALWVDNNTYADSRPLSLLDRISQKWSIDDYLHNSDLCEELAEVIGNANGKAEQVFRGALPNLVDFFVDRPQKPVREFAPLYGRLIEIIAWGGVCSTDELELVSSLTESLLACGCNVGFYSDCLKTVGEVVKENSSPNNLDWALNTAEIIALYPCQSADIKVDFFMSIIEMVRLNSHRLTKTQIMVLELLEKDYNCLDLISSLPILNQEVDDQETYNSAFDGLIGIYSLTEGAAKRAKAILTKSLPMARIETNSDGVKTERLTHLARNSDIFVFAWKSSKHQAFFGVKQERKTEDIILPSGKGTASIVRSVLDYIDGI